MSWALLLALGERPNCPTEIRQHLSHPQRYLLWRRVRKCLVLRNKEEGKKKKEKTASNGEETLKSSLLLGSGLFLRKHLRLFPAIWQYGLELYSAIVGRWLLSFGFGVFEERLAEHFILSFLPLPVSANLLALFYDNWCHRQRQDGDFKGYFCVKVHNTSRYNLSGNTWLVYWFIYTTNGAAVFNKVQDLLLIASRCSTLYLIISYLVN